MILKTMYFSPCRMSGFCYRPDGVAIDRALSARLFESFTKWENETPEFSDLRSRSSIEEYMKLRLEDILPEFELDQRDDVRCVFNCLMNYCRFHNAGYTEDFPIPDVVGYNDIPGGNIKVPCGMSSVIRGLVRDFPPSVIRLHKQVIKVNWNRYEVQVLCQDGAEHLAEHCICTLPLGYLKHHARDIFSPPLPSSKLEAIDSIPFGKVNKIYLLWENAFWKEGLGGIKLAWDDSSVGVTSQNQWYKKIFAFDEVLNNANVLVAWISGDESEHMESLSDHEVLETCASVIRKFLNDPSIPNPVRILRTKWCGNPYTRGSYSYRNHGVRVDHIRNIAEPVNQAQMPRLLFAGEATDQHGYSTLHGARNSGLREAERLVAYYGLDRKCHL